jgi:hypothetical protein
MIHQQVKGVVHRKPFLSKVKESNSPSYERRVSLMAFLGIGMKPISPFFGE